MDNILNFVNRSNQRGGRMLSVIDLLKAGTLTYPQLCWLLNKILNGSSWLVGARSGGAGKTTVMSALLTMLPEGEEIRLSNPGTGWENSGSGKCVVSYEISPGNYDAYIWGKDVETFTELGKHGCRIVSNLHADTLEEARSQIVDDCGATEEGFSKFDVFLPISMQGNFFSSKKIIKTIRFYNNEKWDTLTDRVLSPEEIAIGEFLSDCLKKKIQTCQEVREQWLKWLHHENNL